MKNGFGLLLKVTLVLAMPLTVALAGLPSAAAEPSAPSINAVLTTYADIAEAKYADSLSGARKLSDAIDALLKKPGQETLEAARKAWISAREPYQQSEAYRFGNIIVDDWESRVNAWPLDEGLIDYVSTEFYGNTSDNELYVANVIANTSLKIGGVDVDTSNITRELLRDKLQEAGGIESNVATGYHAIEFLLWGQDLNGTEAGAGERPATDFDLQNCTNGNCDRRRQYLRVATDLLIEDLDWMVRQWSPTGAARKALIEAEDEKRALLSLFVGLGSLTYGELAGERMKLGLLIHDPEEEHDCFSDNTHNSHYYNALGIRNVYFGSYRRTDGSLVSGPSASDLVRAADPAVDKRVRAAIDAVIARMTELKARGDTIERYDQMIAQGNEGGNAVIQAAIDALVAQAREFERAMAALKLEAAKFEGSDSLDNPEAVQ